VIDAGGAGPGDGLPGALAQLPPDQRKALLLVTIEGFGHADAGAVLGLSAETVGRLVLAAREALRRLLSLRVLVIEDEPVVAMSIAHILTHMGHEVCGIAHTQREALARARASMPNLILADVRLRDGDNGIAAVRAITRHQAIPVIFLTGHATDLIAQDLRPALVVGKPFAPRTLEAAVRRVLARQSAGC
jgi:CheY-like chemotaxis protein